MTNKISAQYMENIFLNTYVESLCLVLASSARWLRLRLMYGSGAPPPILLALIPRAECTVTCRTPIAVSIGAPDSICSKFNVKTGYFCETSVPVTIT